MNDFNEKDDVLIYVSTGGEYNPLRLSVHKLMRGDSESFCLFKSTKYVIDFLNVRSLKMKTTDSTHKGLKIPNSAIVDKTFLKIPLEFADSDKKTVVRRELDGDRTVSISERGNDEDYVYVLMEFDKLKIGDTLVKPGSDETLIIEDVMNVIGVYMVNNGVAEFRRLMFDSEILANSSYSIIDPALNTGENSLKVYDRIITDAKEVVEGQRVY